MKGTGAAGLAYVDLRNLVWSSCLSKHNSAVRIGDSGLLQVLVMVAAQPLSEARLIFDIPCHFLLDGAPLDKPVEQRS